MKKCPRCHLPQEGLYRCEYCGYLLSQKKETHIKKIQSRLKDFIKGLNREYTFTSKPKSEARSEHKAAGKLKLADNGGTRSGTERRKYMQRTYHPEKRSGRDRRKGVDRRRRVAKKRWSERRFSLKQATPYPRRT